VKKCMEYEVEGSRPRGRPKRTWKEVVREDCQARKLNRGCHGPLQAEMRAFIGFLILTGTSWAQLEPLHDLSYICSSYVT